MINRLLRSADLFVQLDVAVVPSVEHREGPSCWVLQFEGKFTALPILSGRDAMPSASSVLVERDNEEGSSAIQGARHGAIRTSRTGVLNSLDVNLVPVWIIWLG